MSEHRDALAWAEAQVAATRDDPAARLALLVRTYHGPTGRAPRHLPFRRAALTFMRWQAQRGLLNPLEASPPRQPLVAGGQRAPAERPMRSDRARGRSIRRAVVAGRAAVAGVRRYLDTVSLVPGSQRQHRGRSPGARRACRRRERSGALLHERRVGARPLRARPRRGRAPGAGAVGGAARTLGGPRLGMAGAFACTVLVLEDVETAVDVAVNDASVLRHHVS
jgi:hypothetical protein